MGYLLLTAGMILLYILEGFHDRSVEKMYSGSSENEFVKEWHRRDWNFHVLLGAIISATYNSQLYDFTDKWFWINWGIVLIHIGLIRMLTLNSTLNLIKKKKIWYLGATAGIDIKLKACEKLVFIMLILLNIVCIFTEIKYL